MKRLKLVSVLFLMTIALFSAVPSNQQVKKLKLELTLEQADLVYGALGKMPADQVEPLRKYIKEEFEKQFPENIKK